MFSLIPQPQKSKIIASAIITLFAAWIAVGLHYTGMLEPYSLKTLDLFFKEICLPLPSPDIVIITVAQPDLDFFKEHSITWPWPRQLYVPLLEFLQRAGARGVVLDILFIERSSYGPQDDLALAECLARMGNVILPGFLSRHPDNEGKPGEEVLAKLTSSVSGTAPSHFTKYRSVRPPVNELSVAASAIGNVECRPDSDGVYRRMPLVSFYDGRWVASLPFAAFQSIHPGVSYTINDAGIFGGGRHFPLDRNGNLFIKFRGPSGTFPTFSAANVIQSQFLLNQGLPPIYEPRVFTGKWVFVGLTAPGLMDLKPTPTDPVFAGVEIHATVFDNLLQGDFLHTMPQGWFWALSFVLAALTTSAVILKPKPLVYLPMTAAVFGAHLGAAIWAFHEGWWSDPVIPVIAQTLAFSTGAVYSYATEGRQRVAIRRMFAHYLSETIIDHLLQHPEKVRLGGERRQVTIFFSDLAGFTSFSENMPPEQIVSMLNEYMSVMTEIILEEGGTVDKFEGDAIMAFWGAPSEMEDHACRACKAAIRQQRALAKLNGSLTKRGFPPLKARIGVHTGEVVVGNLGSQRRFDYTIIGDAVNLASRLEGLNKFYGTSILASEETVKRSGTAIASRELGDVIVKGKAKPVKVYEVLGFKEEIGSQQARAMAIFARGLQFYKEARFQQAMEQFAKVLRIIPGDGPSVFFLERCRRIEGGPVVAQLDFVGERADI